MITVRADMPTMDGRITMTCEPMFDEYITNALWAPKPDPKWKHVCESGPVVTHANLRETTTTEYHETEMDDGDWDEREVTLCNSCGDDLHPHYINDSTLCYELKQHYLGMKTTLTYHEPENDHHHDRTWIFRNDELTQQILDLGHLTDEIIEALGPPEVESWRQW